MKFKIKQFFNMIEVTLAIGILAMGATAVLVLFPLGMERNKDSIGENYCADAAGDIIAYIESKGISNWNYVLAIPIVKKDIRGSSRYKKDFEFGNLLAGTIYEADDVDTENNPIDDGIYGINFTTGNEVSDFMGEIQMWRSSVSSDIAISLNIEISWPVTMRYDIRNKNSYYVELYNYNY